MAEPLIGQDIVPPDLRAKITGRARYAEDFRADGMVFAKMLLSPMPHARVRRIDASAALRMDGVLGILTAEDVPSVEVPAEPILTMEPVYEGEPVLAIAAVDETTAAAAIERVDVDFEPLPFVLDPLRSLAPDGPNARLEGNIFHIDDDVREMRVHKWRTRDYANAPEGRLPMGEPSMGWSIGDVEAGLADAAVVIEETLVHQSLTHHPMEPRSCMAYWQNGRAYVHASTQSAARCRASLAGMMGIDIEDLVVVAEYCGGGFGSKITAHPSMAVTALLSRKVGRPVMLRVTRYEESYIGRARAGFQAHARLGFRRDGRMTALDLFIVQDQGPYGRAGDINTAATVASLAYQPETMRYRGVSVFTNTPPRSAQRAPGGAQIIGMLEPLIDKAARELGIDRVAVRRVNAPDNDGWVGPGRGGLTSAYPREALDRGAELFGWDDKQGLSGRRVGTKVTGLGVGLSPFVSGSSGFDGLVVIRPDGKLYVHQGIGNLGTHSVADTARAAADALGLAWDDVVLVWGDSSRHQPWSSVQAGSQTTHAHTRANFAAGELARRRLQEIAAHDLGGAADQYAVADGRVFRRGSPGRGMSLGRAAERAIELGGVYDGHALSDDLHDMTRAAATGLAGQGLVAAARDNYPHEGSTFSWVAGFAQVEIDVETGDLQVVDYAAVTDCGRVLHPRSLGAQVFGGSIQGMGIAMSQKWVYDPKWGVPFAKRLYTARPPGMLDVPLRPRWAAVGIPDPQTPVGAKGIGEPPVGAGSAAIACAVADALGGECLCRTPLTADVILAAIEGTEKPYRPLETHV